MVLRWGTIEPDRVAVRGNPRGSSVAFSIGVRAFVGLVRQITCADTRICGDFRRGFSSSRSFQDK